MSIKCMHRVWEKSEHKSSALILMLAIADNADDTGLAWPGYDYLSEKTRMSRRTVIRLVSTCQESGELWVLHRPRQRSNIYIVTVGTSLAELEQAAIKAAKMGALPTTGSDILTPPPQVLEIVNRVYEVPKCHQVVIPGSPSSDIAMSPEPSGTVTNRSGTVIEPPPTPQVDVDGHVLEDLNMLGVSGRKATELVVSYTESSELSMLIPRLSAWLKHLNRQDGIKSPIGLAITKTEQRADPPQQKESQDSHRFIEGEYADFIVS